MRLTETSSAPTFGEEPRTNNFNCLEKIGSPVGLHIKPFFPRPELIDIIDFTWGRQYQQQSFLEQKNLTERLSIAQIAELCFSSKAAIRANLLRFKIPIRELGKPHGRPSQPRFGKKIINGTEVVHKYEARVVATVYELNKQGLSLRAIAKVLTDMQISTKCRGKAWHPEMINRILTNFSN